MKQDKSQWLDHVYSIINKYNNEEHNVIQIKPVDATKKKTFYGLLGICKTMQKETVAIQRFPLGIW